MKPMNLGVVWFCNGITGWLYRDQEDNLDIIKEPGYFDRTSELANIGDQIYVVAKDGAKMFWVSQITPHVEIKEL